MSDASSDAPTETFYESTRSYRNSKSAVLLILVPVFAVLPIWGMLAGLPRGHYGGGSYIFATILSIAFIAGLVKLIYNIAADVRETVRVDSEGVVVPGGQRIRWSDITTVRFDRAPFSRRGYLAVELARQPGYFRSVRGQSALSVEEAAQRLERIAAFLATSQPRIKVLAPKTT